MFGRQQAKGYTLVEMITVLAIIGVAVAIAAPVVSQFRTNARLQSSAVDLASMLKTARAEGLNHLQDVQLQIIPTIDSANPWGKTGWRIWDMTRNAEISRIAAISDSIVITATPAETALLFKASGAVQKTDGTPVDVVFKVCDASTTKETGRDVVITRFGRVFVRLHAGPTICN